MKTKIVASLLFAALCVLGSSAWTAAASPPAAPAPSTGANTVNTDPMMSPGGILWSPPPLGSPTTPGPLTTPPATASPTPSSSYPSPYHSQIPNVPYTTPLGTGTGGTQNTPGTGGGTGTGQPLAP